MVFCFKGVDHGFLCFKRVDHGFLCFKCIRAGSHDPVQESIITQILRT